MKAKFIKDVLNEDIKYGVHAYKIFDTDEGKIYASREGILGDKKTFISWGTVRALMKKFNK